MAYQHYGPLNQLHFTEERQSYPSQVLRQHLSAELSPTAICEPYI